MNGMVVQLCIHCGLGSHECMVSSIMPQFHSYRTGKWQICIVGETGP
jgi:hypothetical protein